MAREPRLSEAVKTAALNARTAHRLALLVDTGRISLDLSPDAWVDRFTGRPGTDAVPLTTRAASRAYRLHHLPHRDPADRLLIATAIELVCPLVTYDGHIEAFAQAHGSRYGLTTRA
nr:PIN domain-containing protein [uncultured Rhodopila sp.]